MLEKVVQASVLASLFFIGFANGIIIALNVISIVLIIVLRPYKGVSHKEKSA
jgi:hypothetical protein